MAPPEGVWSPEAIQLVSTAGKGSGCASLCRLLILEYFMYYPLLAFLLALLVLRWAALLLMRPSAFELRSRIRENLALLEVAIAQVARHQGTGEDHRAAAELLANARLELAALQVLAGERLESTKDTGELSAILGRLMSALSTVNRARRLVAPPFEDDDERR